MRRELKTYTIHCDYCDHKTVVQGEDMPKGWARVDAMCEGMSYGNHTSMHKCKKDACPTCAAKKKTPIPITQAHYD